MPQFLFTAVNRKGATVTERVEAESVSGARDKLETRGFSGITFHTDEFSARMDSAVAEGAQAPSPAGRLGVGPRQMIERLPLNCICPHQRKS